ncbi:MAG: hypothetical protein R2706_11020 [Acidimicrobiales bacterium]
MAEIAVGPGTTSMVQPASMAERTKRSPGSETRACRRRKRAPPFLPLSTSPNEVAGRAELGVFIDNDEGPLRHPDVLQEQAGPTRASSQAMTSA